MSYFLDIICEYGEAKAELKKCADGCDYDAGYFCAQYQQDVDRIESLFEKELKSIIIEVINEE